MRIDPRFAAPQAAPPTRTRETGGRFSLAEDRAPRTSGTRAAASPATLDAILALQSEEDPGQRRRRSAQGGRDVLDALDALKAALLGGAVAPAMLAGITSRLALLGPSGDAGLDRVLGEIELRARVELAKLGRADLA